MSAHVFRTLAAGDVNRIQLVQECRYLEENLATSFTTRIQQQASEVDARELKKTIIAKDWNQTIQQALSHQKSKMVVEVTSWMKIWDVTLDKGPRGTSPCWHCSLRSLSLLLAANHVHTVT